MTLHAEIYWGHAQDRYFSYSDEFAQERVVWDLSHVQPDLLVDNFAQGSGLELNDH